jgi:hypothetical protein
MTESILGKFPEFVVRSVVLCEVVFQETITMSIKNPSDETIRKFLAFVFAPDDDYTKEREAMEDQADLESLSIAALHINLVAEASVEPPAKSSAPTSQDPLLNRHTEE